MLRFALKSALMLGVIQVLLVGAVMALARVLPRDEWQMAAFVPGDTPTIHLLDVRHNLIHPLPAAVNEVHSSPVWSPDGRYLAFGVNDAFIRLYDSATYTTRDIKNSVQDREPVWSPDGKTLYFHSFVDRDFNFYALNIETGDMREAITGSFKKDYLTLSPDGEKFAWLEYAGIQTGYELFISGANGENRRQITSDPDTEIRFTPFSWSPDSKQVVCVTQVNELRAITTIDVETGEVKRILRVDAYNPEPRWSDDGKRIAYWIADTRDQSTLYVVDADGSNVRRIATFTPQITLAAWR